MSCCSSRRGALAAAPQLRAAAPIAPPARTSSADRQLRYRGQAAMVLRGPFSGRVYELTPSAADLAADPGDVEALLRTGLFEAV